MTIRSVNPTPAMYVGLSTDTKPTAGVAPGAIFIETDTDKRYLWTGSTQQGTTADWVNRNDPVTLGKAIAGERNPDSSTNSYLATYSPANLSVISKTTAVTIGAGAANDTHLLAVIIHTALTGTLAITGFADSDGTAQTYTIPAAFVGTLDFKGAINSAGALTMTASNAADDNKIAVLWRAI